MNIFRPIILLPIAVVLAGLLVFFFSTNRHSQSGTLAELRVSTARSLPPAFEARERSAPGIDASQVENKSYSCDVAELRAAQQELDSSRRYERLRRLGILFAAHDLAFAQSAFATLTRSDDKFAFLSGMMDSWMAVNAEAALSFLHQLPASTYRPHVAVQALGILARRDAQRAFDWMPKLVSGSHRDNAAMTIISTLASYDLSGALDFANAQRSSQGRGAFAEMAVSEATQMNPARVREILESRSDLTTEVRQAALNALAGVWALEAGSDATNWAERMFAQTGSSRPLELALINWATVDAPAAANALSRRLGESWSGGAAEEIAASWADQDPESAAAWVTALPSSPTREAAMDAFVTAWSQSDTSAALRWAIALPERDPARFSAILQACYAFRENDEPGLHAFLGALPVHQRTQLQQVLEVTPSVRTAIFTDRDPGFNSR